MTIMPRVFEAIILLTTSVLQPHWSRSVHWNEHVHSSSRFAWSVVSGKDATSLVPLLLGQPSRITVCYGRNIWM